MATTADVIEMSEITLQGIEKETAFLPELAARWPELPEIDHASWELEWSELMRHLETLDAAYRAGALTADQERCYPALLRQLRAALPVIDELDFERPTVPLEA
jgi:hypothetical protein